MPRAPTNRQADIKRAIGALKAFGLGVARIDFPPAGGFSVVPGPLTPEPAERELSDLERFRAEKARRGLRAP